MAAAAAAEQAGLGIDGEQADREGGCGKGKEAFHGVGALGREACKGGLPSTTAGGSNDPHSVS